MHAVQILKETEMLGNIGTNTWGSWNLGRCYVHIRRCDHKGVRTGIQQRKSVIISGGQQLKNSVNVGTSIPRVTTIFLLNIPQRWIQLRIFIHLRSPAVTKCRACVLMPLWTTQRQLWKMLRVRLIIYWLYFTVFTWFHRQWERNNLMLLEIQKSNLQYWWTRLKGNYQDTGSCFGKPSGKKNCKRSFSRIWSLLLMEAENTATENVILEELCYLLGFFFPDTWSTFTT